MEIQRMVKFTVSTIDKEYFITIPTNGQYIEIEKMKARLTGNQYNNMMTTTTVSSVIALDLVDCIAWLTVCCPQLINDLNMKNKSLLDISVADSRELVNLYRKTIFPWIQNWMTVFANPEVQAKDDK